MPLYYFDTKIHGEVHRDCDGEEFDRAEDAVQHAKLGAAEYGADLIKHDVRLDGEIRIVRSAGGDILARFSVRDALIEIAKGE